MTVIHTGSLGDHVEYGSVALEKYVPVCIGRNDTCEPSRSKPYMNMSCTSVQFLYYMLCYSEFFRAFRALFKLVVTRSVSLHTTLGEEEEEEEGEGALEDVFELEEMLASELDINVGPEELAQRHAMLAMRQGAAGDGRGGWEGAAAGAHGQPSQEQKQPVASAPPPVDEMANKMDSMMELAFEHLRRRIAAGECVCVC